MTPVIENASVKTARTRSIMRTMKVRYAMVMEDLGLVDGRSKDWRLWWMSQECPQVQVSPYGGEIVS